MKKQQIVAANMGGFTIRKHIDEVIKMAEGKGYEADRVKDTRMKHHYWQIAEHWKRVKNEEDV